MAEISLKFYGTRGSIPVPHRDYLEFGGNTTCMRIKIPELNRIGVLDAGTGIRQLGIDLIAGGHQQEDWLMIGFTHFHWDHIQGFPFFLPAYSPQQRIHILAMGKDGNPQSIQEIFETQMKAEFFPVQLANLSAEFKFLIPDPKGNELNNTRVETLLLNHPGGSYGYKWTRNGKSIVVCTDVEHSNGIDERVVEFARGADLLVHEGQYTPEELKTRAGWGHSSYLQAIEVAQRAEVKQLAITHHDPDHNDDFLRAMEKQCQDIFPDSVLAREGMEFSV